MLMDVSVFAKVDCLQPSIFSYFYSGQNRPKTERQRKRNEFFVWPVRSPFRPYHVVLRETSNPTCCYPWNNSVKNVISPGLFHYMVALIV